MKKHTKLFLLAIAIFFAGFIRASAPTAIDQPFDSLRFIWLCIIAFIVFVIGVVKYLKGE